MQPSPRWRIKVPVPDIFDDSVSCLDAESPFGCNSNSPDMMPAASAFRYLGKDQVAGIEARDGLAAHGIAARQTVCGQPGAGAAPHRLDCERRNFPAGERIRLARAGGIKRMRLRLSVVRTPGFGCPLFCALRIKTMEGLIAVRSTMCLLD